MINTIDLDRQILRTFNQMEPDVEYLFQEQVWNQLMKERQARWGYSPLDRQAYILCRRGTKLMLKTSLVWDFATPPTALAFAFAFALALTSLAFAFSFAFSFAFAIEKRQAPYTPPDAQTQKPHFDGLKQMCRLEGGWDGFWYEPNHAQDFQLAGIVEDKGSVALHLHGLDPDTAAQILALIRQRIG